MDLTANHNQLTAITLCLLYVLDAYLSHIQEITCPCFIIYIHNVSYVNNGVKLVVYLYIVCDTYRTLICYSFPREVHCILQQQQNNILCLNIDCSMMAYLKKIYDELIHTYRITHFNKSIHKSQRIYDYCLKHLYGTFVTLLNQSSLLPHSFKW